MGPRKEGHCDACHGKLKGAVYYDLPDPAGPGADSLWPILAVCYACLDATGSLRADGKPPNGYQVKKALEFRALGYRRIHYQNVQATGLNLDQVLMKRQPHRGGDIHYRILGPSYVILVPPQAIPATAMVAWATFTAKGTE